MKPLVEKWEVVKDFPDYEVSNLGRVKVLSRSISRKNKFGEVHFVDRNEQVLTAKKRGQYLAVKLYRNGMPQFQSIHRLVASAFIPNPFNLPCVNHKDEVGHNNSSDNLEWCTYQYNSAYSLAKQIMLISPDGDVVIVEGIKEFCRNNNLRYSSIYRLLRGKQHQHKNWRAYSPVS